MEQTNISAADIARILQKELQGRNVTITRPASLDHIGEGRLLFALRYSDETAQRLNEHPNALVICAPQYEGKLNCSYIVSQNPRLDFIKVMRAFFLPKEDTGIHPTALIEQGAQLAAGVSVGAFAYIGSDVVIGENTRIAAYAKVHGRVRIGKNCLVREGAIIGGVSMGYEWDEQGIPLEFPQVGGVRIGDNVVIGMRSVVSRAALDDTIICDNVKMDTDTGVGHNCYVGQGTILIAQARLSGSVHIGNKCMIGARTWISPGIRIGKHVTVWANSVVMRNVKDNNVVAGNPARPVGMRDD